MGICDSEYRCTVIMQQLNRSFSRVSTREDELVPNDELDVEVKIEDRDMGSKTTTRWKNRWKIFSCLLVLLCITFFIALCVIATSYVIVMSEIKHVVRKCLDKRKYYNIAC